MSKPVNNMDYYDLVNLNHFVNKSLLKDNSISFTYLKNFVDEKTSQFKYKGLEEILPDDILEILLTFNNHLSMYKSNVYGVVICKYIDRDLDLYNVPITVDLQSINGKPIAYNVPYKDIVRLKDNNMDIPPFTYLCEYINKMQSIENTLFSNLELLKLPAVFTMDKKLLTTFNKLIENAISTKPLALADQQIMDAFKQFDIKFPVQPESLLELWKNYRNFALQSIGIAGSDTQKRERLLVGEVQSQQEYTDFIYEECKYCREQFVKECNEKFGLHIELVEMKAEYTEQKIKDLAEEKRLSMGIVNRDNPKGDNDKDGSDNKQ